MIRFLGKLWKDRRGNTLVIAGAAMIPLAGAAGLATDTIQWVLWKRELQRAADSAAFAGVYAVAQNEDATSAVTADISKNNNHTGASLLTGYPNVTTAATYGSYTNAVTVDLKIQKGLGFSSLFLATPPVIEAKATAAMIDDGAYCLRTLKKTGGPGITFSGGPTVTLGCGGHSNSNSSPSVDANGSYTVSAPIMAGVGTVGSITGVTKTLSHTMVQSDPYQSKYSTSNPYGNGSCKTFNQNSYTTSVTTGSGKNKVTTTTNHLSAGCYSSFSPNGSNTYYLDPGVYYLSGTDFNLNGQDTIIGTDVVFILDTGSVSVNGTSTVQISAPTSSNCGTYATVNTCNYKNMLFIQSSSATVGNKNTINGTSNSTYDGTMYFPNGELDFTGTAGDMTKCLNVVSYTAVFSGNANLQNNTTGCNAATTTTINEIRLVA